MRRALLLAATLTLLLAGCGSDEPGSGSSAPVREGASPPPKASRAQLKGAPAPLAALHAQSNQLLEGGAEAFEKRLAQLKGYPVVVNKWASWCPPCRAEFPFFANQALKRGKQVAFIGVDSSDNDQDAKKFLSEFPVSYPSYKDPDLKVAAVFKGVGAFPSTAFYDSEGKLAYLKQGGYPSEQKLIEDIERYAR